MWLCFVCFGKLVEREIEEWLLLLLASIRETVESIRCRNSHATPFTVCLRSLFFGCKQREREKRERVSFQTALKKWLKKKTLSSLKSRSFSLIQHMLSVFLLRHLFCFFFLFFKFHILWTRQSCLLVFSWGIFLFSLLGCFVSSHFHLQTCVLKVNIHCDGCKHKVKKLLQRIEGPPFSLL